MPLTSCLYSPVKTSAVHNVTCLYGPAENVKNQATISRRGRSSFALVPLHLYRSFIY